MNVKKFTASSSREVMRLVRETLGDDAVILSNRNVNGQIEILAVGSDSMSSLVAPVYEREAMSVSIPSALSQSEQRAEKRVQQVFASLQKQELPARSAPPKPARIMRSPTGARGEGPVSPQQVDSRLKHVMAELKAMRNLFEVQLAEISWGNRQEREPMWGDLMRQMLSAGFSPGMARYLIENLPENEKKAEGGLQWIRRALARNLHTVGSEDDLLDRGGVYALVGPTGVGKTTTTAKLAARFVMRHGAGKLALITTDGYRIGGFEQLRIYGKILGAMVHSVKDQADLRIALDELKDKHTILIDTVGMSQRDTMVASQIAMLSNAGKDVKRLLCLSATSTGETLNEVVSAYKGRGLAGCIMTKVDEAATVGNVLDVIIRQKLALYYVANGQRVPEDLQLADANALIRHAFNVRKQGRAFAFDDADLPIVVGNSVQTMNQDVTGGA